MRIRDVVRATVRDRVPPGGRAWLIGTLAWGVMGPHSDVDLVLDGIPPAPALEIENAVARATGAPVDILIFGELPAPFRSRVEAEGVPLHAR